MTPARTITDPAAPKLLYIHMAALGDAVMASPALRMLKQGLPGWRIDVLARTHTADYFRSLPWVDEVVSFVNDRHVDRQRPWRLLGGWGEAVRLFQELKGGGYAAVIQWRGQLPDTLMSLCTGARHRIATVQSIHRKSAIPVEKLRFLVTDLVTVSRADAHLVEAMAAPADFLLRKLGGSIPANPDLSMDYPLQAADHAAAAEFLSAHGLAEDVPLACVGISAKTAVNSWPLDRFAAVADHLRLHHGLQVVLTGIPAHRDRERTIAAGMKTEPVCSTGRLPFGALCALLARSRLLVSLNTGLSHIAAALRVPVVVLSGRDGASITPWGAPHRVVTRNPFYPRRHPDRRQWAGLVSLITVDEVRKSIDALMSETYASQS